MNEEKPIDYSNFQIKNDNIEENNQHRDLVSLWKKTDKKTKIEIIILVIILILVLFFVVIHFIQLNPVKGGNLYSPPAE